MADRAPDTVPGAGAGAGSGPGHRSRRRARWDRYTEAAVGGPGVTEDASGPEDPTVGVSGRARSASDPVLQRIRAVLPERHPDQARVYPLVELRLVPVAAATWAAAVLAVRTDSGDACRAGAVLAGTAALVLILALLPAPRARARPADQARASMRHPPGRRPPQRHRPRRRPLHRRSVRNQAGSSRRFPRAAPLARAVAAPVAAAGLVCVGAGVLLADRTAGPIGPAITSGATITGEFRAASDARTVAADRFSGGDRYTVEAVLEQATAGGERFSSTATVLVLGGSGYADVQLGDRFDAAGSLQATEPGERAVALLFANGQPRVEPADGWLGQTARLRSTFARAAAQHSDTLGQDAAGLLPGMVLGDRSTLDGELEAAMKNTGLTHLTAVSGANCAYLLAFVFLTARSIRLPRAAASAAGILALAGFVLVVRPEASVLRAAVMGGLGTLAVLSGRGRLPAALLCLSITVLLAVDPWLSGSYAFILSVLATSGLIVLGPRLTELLSRRMPWLLAAALAVPVSAQLFCSPVLVLLQPQLPVFSLPANVAAAPVIPLVTVAGMAAAVLAVALPPLAGPLLLAAGAGAAWTASVARFFNSQPGSLLPWPEGVPGAVLMTGVSGTVLWLVIRAGTARERTTRRRPAAGATGWAAAGGRGGELFRPGLPGRPGRPGRRRLHWLPSRRAGTAAAVLLLLPPGAAAVRTHFLPGPAPPGWTAAACDVGQGDGLVVRTGTHSALVIDAGPDPEAMDRCLRRLGVDAVDVLILTHAHLDHYGGTAGVLRQREVRQIAYSTAEAELPPQLDAVLQASGAELTRLSAGMSAQAGAARWDVLWPPADTVQPTENDASAVVLVTVDPDAAAQETVEEDPGSGSGAGGNAATGTGKPDQKPDQKSGQEPDQDPDRGLTLLLTGDIEEDAAGQLLHRHPGLRDGGVDVLKVAHHGARNGGTALITGLQPELALISVGADNEYGHPGPSVLNALQDAGTAVARTDTHGSVSLDLDGTTLRVRRLDGP